MTRQVEHRTEGFHGGQTILPCFEILPMTGELFVQGNPDETGKVDVVMVEGEVSAFVSRNIMAYE
jgi:hypothetical protein